jgi:hypothetical protein
VTGLCAQQRPLHADGQRGGRDKEGEWKSWVCVSFPRNVGSSSILVHARQRRGEGEKSDGPVRAEESKMCSSWPGWCSTQRCEVDDARDPTLTVSITSLNCGSSLSATPCASRVCITASCASLRPQHQQRRHSNGCEQASRRGAIGSNRCDPFASM